MKIKSLALFLPLLFLLACSYQKYSLDAPLYNEYKQLVTTIKAKNYQSTLNLMSELQRQRFYKQEDEGFELFFPFFSSVHTVVENESSHFQAIQGNKACLTIIGSNSSGEPTGLNFELIRELNTWRFNKVQMSYFDSTNDYPSEAVCPSNS